MQNLDHSAFLEQWKDADRPQVHRRTSLGWLDSVSYFLSFEHTGKTYETGLYTAQGATPDADPELLEVWEKALSDSR